MGNCCSDVAGGKTAVGGTASDQLNSANGPNEAVDNFLRSRGYNGLFSQIELSFSASGLRDRDIVSKSDPMLVLYERGKNGALKELGRTEVVLNSLNPKWITKHTLTYHFETVQDLVMRVEVHIVNVMQMLKLEEQEHLGEATCALSQIITKFDRSMTLDLHSEDFTRSTQSQNCGKLLVHAEECVSSKTTVEMTLRCCDLEYRDLFSRSDPFLLISKVVEGGSHIPICKTEVIKNDLNPIWKPVFLNIQQIGSKYKGMVTIEILVLELKGGVPVWRNSHLRGKLLGFKLVATTIVGNFNCLLHHQSRAVRPISAPLVAHLFEQQHSLICPFFKLALNSSQRPLCRSGLCLVIVLWVALIVP
ncbi:hypothetical protein V8G54_002239 [Vigna mungo]|uniref:C2 domain-containing protein n=1 Tax=Vigna mungo TaxID=3915 RepID=A0AAQ3P9T6_VIGMU